VGDLINDPQTSTIARQPRSARRTSHVDMDTPSRFEVNIKGAARDFVTAADGSASTVGEANIDISTEPGYKLSRASCEPGQKIIEQLIGRVVGPGFRAALAEAMDGSISVEHPAYLLMDELPVAALISGYIGLYLNTLGNAGNGSGLKADICAGWIESGTMIQSLKKVGKIPTPMGPPAPDLSLGNDSNSWHSMPKLQSGAMRRRRLIDVCDARVFAMFRDTFIAPDTGIETVLHEYSIHAEYDFNTEQFTSCVATPHVLPWPECPNAAASAQRIVGKSAEEVRDFVRREFNGISTCTHLNDLLRSLGDVATLGALISR
jgi:hypothetical protein